MPKRGSSGVLILLLIGDGGRAGCMQCVCGKPGALHAQGIGRVGGLWLERARCSKRRTRDAVNQHSCLDPPGKQRWRRRPFQPGLASHVRLCPHRSEVALCPSRHRLHTTCTTRAPSRRSRPPRRLGPPLPFCPPRPARTSTAWAPIAGMPALAVQVLVDRHATARRARARQQTRPACVHPAMLLADQPNLCEESR